MKRVVLKSVSLTLIFTLVFQLLFPVAAYALTTGPSQPEVQAFEPVGTTEMVDMFTGDFVYNIPLMDIDGYPINISYHSGVTPEQEASWVGLGWSLNPGEINRTVRGLPDDYNGDEMKKHLEITPEENFMGKTGVEIGFEIFGVDLSKYINLGANLSMFMNANNYKGISAGMRAGINASIGMPSSGNMAAARVGVSPSIGIGSQSGTDIDASLSFSVSQMRKTGDDYNTSFGASVGVGSGVNSRSGMKAINFNVGVSTSQGTSKEGKFGKDAGHHISSGQNSSTTVPVGIQNYVPVMTNPSSVLSYYVQMKIGFEIYGWYPNFLVGMSASRMKYEETGDRKGYGYMYLENAARDKSGILDFIRDKDGMYNKTMTYLPMSSLAYDIYSVSGQGTGGSFRPYRNDIGTIYDPYTSSSNHNFSGALEMGFANLFEIGGNVSVYSNEVMTGPWMTTDFQGEKRGTLYEKLFFKQAGELTYNNQLGTVAAPLNAFYSDKEPLNVAAVYPGGNIYAKNAEAAINLSSNTGSGSLSHHMGYASMDDARTPRSNLVSVYTAGKANTEVTTLPDYYDNTNPSLPVVRTLDRINPNNASEGYTDRMSAVSQTLPDGRRYVYGIPAMNNITKDVTFGYAPSSSDPSYKSGGLTSVTLPTDGGAAPKPEKYFSKSESSGYAHSFLLTEVLSPDYIDITGNGCSDDDLGGYVRMNYMLTSKDYRWRSPADTGTAHFDPGFQSDLKDGRASVSMGSRQQWYVKSIESKNLVAEFYSSLRVDARGSSEAIDGGYAAVDDTHISQQSYKLDSIRLFNKSERIYGGSNAVPIKTVIFKYDYSLCPGTPNSTSGKLTLKQLFIRYGTSDKNLLNPYQFVYNRPSDSYNYAHKDRWGNRKSTNINGSLNNFEFPYASQETYSTLNDDPATSHNLKEVILPSGGKLKVYYESDDYAYVQDRRAMQMFMIEGFGEGTDYVPGALLYEDAGRQFNYVYFKRQADDGLSATPTSGALRKRYLNDEKHLYYSVSVDVRGGAYEQIKGFGEVVNMGLCTGSANSSGDYVYVELKKVNASDVEFNPVALYAMNFCRSNINHIFYPGYGTNNLKAVLNAFKLAAEEIKHMKRPHRTFVERGYCKHLNPAKSWIRLQSPTLCKKGGGIRVKKLTMSDQWNEMTASSLQETGEYGKEYDYTVIDAVYGRISSGVASYEPLTGGDENPLRRPVPYIAASNIAMPAIEFYQLEPLGENFYPGGMVGYSSVKARSIHISEGNSSMSEQEHLFYTARDFPIRVSHTNKNTHSYHERGLFKSSVLEQASQGYTLFLNDMHGKPKAVNNYLVKDYSDNQVKERELVNGTNYYYNKDNEGKLNSRVMAMVRTSTGAVVKEMELGKETDLTFDSRQNYDNTISIGADLNLNVVIYGVYPVPIPMILPSYNRQTTVFHSMVATKLVQQYGILKKVETIDHGAITTQENLVYDGESGNVLLSRTNNEFNDLEYAEKLPAYYRYDGMGPAYANVGFSEDPEKLYINRAREGYMFTPNVGIYTPGDELLYEKDNAPDKLWVIDKKVFSLSEYYGFSKSNKAYMAFFPGESGTFKVVIDGSTTIYPNIQYGSDPLALVFNSTNLVELTPGSHTLSVTKLDVLNIPIAELCGSSSITINLVAGQFNTYRPEDGDCNGEGSGISMPSVPQPSQCLLKVAPRNTIKHALNSSASTIWWWSNPTARFVTDFSTEIIRSGRRNMLTPTIQEAVSTSVPAYTEGSTLSNFLVKTGLISIAAQTYTQEALPYEGQEWLNVPNSVSDADNNVYEGYNNILMGLQGNFRPKEQYVALANRDYSTYHARRAGTFSLSTLIWNPTLSSNGCETPYYVQNGSPAAGEWKKATTVTKYDAYGNALEEQDAVGVYSAALYGFNRKLPVAVASNARQESFMFESFEDLNSILIPEHLRRLYYNFSVTGTNAQNSGVDISTARPVPAYLANPFAQLFYGFSGTTYTYNGMKYYRMSPSTSAVTIGTGADVAHTGTKSLSISGSWNVDVNVKSAYATDKIGAFSVLKTKKYLVSFWQRSSSGSVVPANIIAGSTTIPFAAKGKAVEGWRLMEAEIDMAAMSSSLTSITLNFTAAMKLDDIRIMPSEANMKSFVYDHVNNRLQAQLDENHYATFYEYDQEGQLVRVKKETEQGVLTISESRKGMLKNY